MSSLTGYAKQSYCVGAGSSSAPDNTEAPCWEMCRVGDGGGTSPTERLNTVSWSQAESGTDGGPYRAEARLPFSPFLCLRDAMRELTPYCSERSREMRLPRSPAQKVRYLAAVFSTAQEGPGDKLSRSLATLLHARPPSWFCGVT